MQMWMWHWDCEGAQGSCGVLQVTPGLRVSVQLCVWFQGWCRAGMSQGLHGWHGPEPWRASLLHHGLCPDLEHVECWSQAETWGEMAEIQKNSLSGLLEPQHGMF